MPTRLVSALLFSLALITSACSSPMKTPDIKQNPHPVEHYEITMTVHGASRGFDSAQGGAVYEVENPTICVKADPISGNQSNLEQSIPFTITKVDEHNYKGAIEVDHFIDADYYGMGICHWVVTAVATFKINGNSIDIAPNMSGSDIVDQKSIDVYFPMTELSSNGPHSYGDSGQSFSELSPKIRDKVFYITLSSKRVKI